MNENLFLCKEYTVHIWLHPRRTDCSYNHTGHTWDHILSFVKRLWSFRPGLRSGVGPFEHPAGPGYPTCKILIGSATNRKYIEHHIFGHGNRISGLCGRFCSRTYRYLRMRGEGSCRPDSLYLFHRYLLHQIPAHGIS